MIWKHHASDVEVISCLQFGMPWIFGIHGQSTRFLLLEPPLIHWMLMFNESLFHCPPWISKNTGETFHGIVGAFHGFNFDLGNVMHIKQEINLGSCLGSIKSWGAKLGVQNWGILNWQDGSCSWACLNWWQDWSCCCSWQMMSCTGGTKWDSGLACPSWALNLGHHGRQLVTCHGCSLSTHSGAPEFIKWKWEWVHNSGSPEPPDSQGTVPQSSMGMIVGSLGENTVILQSWMGKDANKRVGLRKDPCLAWLSCLRTHGLNLSHGTLRGIWALCPQWNAGTLSSVSHITKRHCWGLWFLSEHLVLSWKFNWKQWINFSFESTLDDQRCQIWHQRIVSYKLLGP